MPGGPGGAGGADGGASVPAGATHSGTDGSPGPYCCVMCSPSGLRLSCHERSPHNGVMSGRILVIDDDTALAEMIGIVLRADGFDPVFCDNGEQAVEVFRESNPDAILLDLMLPGKSGIDVCREIRLESGVPIIMLTAKSDTVDVVLGLESGADDYIPKPFKPRELIARVRARLRRTTGTTPAVVRIGDLEIDVAGPPGDAGRRLDPVDAARVRRARDARAVAGSGLHPGGAARERLGVPAPGGQPLVNVHIQRLRAKIEKDPENPEIVLTVRGLGYKAGGTPS